MDALTAQESVIISHLSRNLLDDSQTEITVGRHITMWLDLFAKQLFFHFHDAMYTSLKSFFMDSLTIKESVIISHLSRLLLDDSQTEDNSR